MANENQNLTHPNDLVDISLLSYFEGKIGMKYATMAAVAATYATKTELGNATLIPINVEDVTPSTVFEKNSVIGIKGVIFRAVRRTREFPVVVLEQDGHIVLDEDADGNKAFVVESWTQSEDWETWTDASIPRMIEAFEDSVQADMTEFEGDINAEMTQFKQDINAEMAQYKRGVNTDMEQYKTLTSAIVAMSIKSDTTVTASSGKSYSVQQLLESLADLMESTIVTQG